MGLGFRLLLLQELKCGPVGRVPPIGASVRMPQPISKIHPLYCASDLAGESGGAGNEANMGEIVRFRSTVREPGQQPQRPQLVISESTRQQFLFGDRGVFQDVMKPRHRPRKDRGGLGDPPDVEDQGITSCVQRTSMGALGDPSGASDSHARYRGFPRFDVDCIGVACSSVPRHHRQLDEATNLDYGAISVKFFWLDEVNRC